MARRFGFTTGVAGIALGVIVACAHGQSGNGDAIERVPVPGGSTAAVTAPPAQPTAIAGCTRDFGDWQYWWEYNQDRFLDVRRSLATGTTTSWETGFLCTLGASRKVAGSGTRPAPDVVASRIVPILKSVLGEDDPDVVDSAVLALGRIVPRESAALCGAEILAALGSRYRSVQQSAILALGILGDWNAVRPLTAILNDTSEGRDLLREITPIQDLHRSFAAIALGYLGTPESIPVLHDAFRTLGAEKKGIRGSIVAALGLFAGHAAENVSFLGALLADLTLEPDVAAQAPIALARLGVDSAVPQLLALAACPTTPERVEESAIVALGTLARPEHHDVVATLREKILRGTNEQARHFAIVALADIADRASTRDLDANRAFVRATIEVLADELASVEHPRHHPWSALGLAIVARNLAPDAAERIGVTAEIAARFDSETKPSDRAAYAIALGILRAAAIGEKVRNAMLDSNDAGFQGCFAVALGMSKDVEAREVLRKLLLVARDPSLRLRVATGLGQMGDSQASELLADALREAKTLVDISSLSRALGRIGDTRAIDAIENLVADESATGLARGFGCLALGMLAEKTDPPWNARLAVGSNYRTQISALREVLDIL